MYFESMKGLVTSFIGLEYSEESKKKVPHTIMAAEKLPTMHHRVVMGNYALYGNSQRQFLSKSFFGENTF